MAVEIEVGIAPMDKSRRARQTAQNQGPDIASALFFVVSTLSIFLSIIAVLILQSNPACASPLSDYPAPYLRDGEFDGSLIVGSSADPSDVLSGIDIATGLQAENTVIAGAGGPLEGGLPFLGLGDVVTQGDVVELSSPNELLGINNFIGEYRDALTEFDLKALKSGSILTSDGFFTRYNQYLRFSNVWEDAFNSTLFVALDEKGGSSALQAPSLPGSIMYEYDLKFQEGLRSEIKSTRKAPGMHNKLFNFMGSPAWILESYLASDNVSLRLRILTNGIKDTLSSGQSKQYLIKGKKYDVKILQINKQKVSAVFRINGQITRSLQNTDLTVLPDGLQLGINAIIPNERGSALEDDLVEFYIGSDEVTFQDKMDDLNFTRGVSINGVTNDDGLVSLRGIILDDKYLDILSVKYRLEADMLGYKDIYILPGQGVHQVLNHPEAMITNGWDIIYGGLVDTGSSTLGIVPSSDDIYRLRFTSQEGLEYFIDFLHNDPALGLQVGGDNGRLHWIEGANNTDYFISPQDTFILTDTNTEKGFTHVVEYQNYDSGTGSLVMLDLAGQSREFPVVANKTNLVFGGSTYSAYLGPEPDFNITVDFNHDGVIGDGVHNDANVQCSSQLHYLIGLSINSTGGLLNPNRSITSSTSSGEVGPCRAAIVIKGGGVLDLGVCDGRNPPGHFDPLVSGLNRTTCRANWKANTTSVLDSDAAGGGEFKLNGSSGSVTTIFQIGLKTLGNQFSQNSPRRKGGDEVSLFGIQNRTNTKLGIAVRDLQSRFGSGEPLPGLDMTDLRENLDITRGLTDFGTFIQVYDPAGTSQSEELTIEYPLAQKGVHVYVAAGEYNITRAINTPTWRKLNKIQVGQAVLDSEVKDVFSQNSIVVGGPCANKAAAELMGNFFDCTVGFYPGRGLIKSFEKDGKQALLVAGYDSIDTRKAARVLSSHKTYELFGYGVEVYGPLAKPKAGPLRIEMGIMD